IGTGHDAPGRAVPVHCQRVGVSIQIVAHGPYVIRGDGSNCHQLAWTGTLARNDAPCGAVPVLGKVLAIVVAIAIGPHSPNIVGRYGVYVEQPTIKRASIGTGYHTPSRAVPVLGQRMRDIARIFVIPDGPHIVGGARVYTRQLVVVRADVGA